MVDLALINNGNQSEIVRYVIFYYTEDGQTGYSLDPHVLNKQIARGDKEVCHFDLDRKILFRNKLMRVDVGIVAIAPDATDIESKIGIGPFNIASDGNGGATPGPVPSESVKVVSDERLPSQKAVTPAMGY